MNIICGDCIDEIKKLEDNSIDSIITDPPYGLSKHTEKLTTECLLAWCKGERFLPKGRGFMGKEWDAWVPGPEIWKECFRVLKPGGNIIVFAGTRSSDLMSIALRLSGFENRDTLMWAYGSGLPKSHNISKAIDKKANAERKVISVRIDGRGRSPQKIDNHEKGDTGIGHMDGSKQTYNETEPATEDAKKWEGWGTALKPAYEPILWFRKPLSEKTVAANVLKYGTGGINIDGCRVGTTDNLNGGTYSKNTQETRDSQVPMNGIDREFVQPKGRFPANIIHDGSDEALSCFPESKGMSGGGAKDKNKKKDWVIQDFNRQIVKDEWIRCDSGSAARFFYCAKASKKDRNEGLDDKSNFHPTVKPTALMQYLCRMFTQPNGIILDPFAGSFSTGKAAIKEGFNFIGIEKEQEYCEIGGARIKGEYGD